MLHLELQPKTVSSVWIRTLVKTPLHNLRLCLLNTALYNFIGYDRLQEWFSGTKDRASVPQKLSGGIPMG